MVLAVALLSGCRGERAASPRTDFLVSAGDSTFWVQSHRAGFRLRASPILLTSFDGRYFEIYVTDDDRSYSTAVFVGQRVWRRDVLSGDSAVVYEDSVVVAHAESYGAAHPGAVRLAPDDDLEEDPERSVAAEVSVIEVHGPFLSFEHHMDYEDRGHPAWHTTRRGVIDLRDGRQVNSQDLLGGEESRRVLGAARHAYQSAFDSVRASSTEGGRRAAASLSSFTFDERSFGITHVRGEFALAFAAPGLGEGTVGAVTLPLSPIRAAAPDWWDEVRPSLPHEGDERSDRWRRSGYDVEARYDTGTAELWVADEGGRRWSIGQLPAPVSMIHWLDRPRIESRLRAALSRAFEEAAYYDETVRTASLRTHSNETGKERKRVAARDIRAHDAAGCEQPRPRVRRRDTVDDGQVGGHRGVPSFADERGDGVDRSRGLSRTDPHG
jgi:hypothetical protein